MKTTGHCPRRQFSAPLQAFALAFVNACGAPAPPTHAVSEEPAPTVEAPRSTPSAASPQAATAPNSAAPSSDVKRPGATVAETRTNQVIQGVVLQNRVRIRSCYEAALTQQPNLAGKLTVQFTIDASGKVTVAEVNQARTTLRDPKVQACTLAAVQSLTFPASSRGFESSVNYPFDFKP
jgi:outer membrane biosynthesis protein TonB